MADRKTSEADEMTELRAELEALRTDMRALGETLKGLAAHQAEGLSETLRQRLGSLGQEAGEKLRAGAEPLERAAGQAADYARAEPLKALGLALGAGLILGLIFGRR